MKKITKRNCDKLLTTNRSLIKGTADPTEVFVYMGHPISEYFGETNPDKMNLHSLTSGHIRSFIIDDDDQEFYLVESESDALSGMKSEKDETVLSRIKKAFK